MSINTRSSFLVLRYAEIGLKKRNRGLFEKSLHRNLTARLSGLEIENVDRRWGRLLVYMRNPSDCREAAERVRDVFGVSSVSVARQCASTLDDIGKEARALLRDSLAEHRNAETFRVRTRRGDKSFPMTSPEIDASIGGRILEVYPHLKVRLKNADLEVGVEVSRSHALVFADSWRGIGGLPVGSSGRAVAMISGGIDSAVACWLAMKRGLKLHFVYFHSPPFVGAQAQEKVFDLAQELSRFQGRGTLSVIPFTPVQIAVKNKAPVSYRTLLYRRLMNRIAATLAQEENIPAVVTGDSLGQVASQTLDNLLRMDEGVSSFMIRPLISYDKEETIRIARRIGTFDIAVRPYPDCCTVFQPREPETHGRREVVQDVEDSLNVEELVAQSLMNRESYEVTWDKGVRLRAPASNAPVISALPPRKPENESTGEI